MSLSVPSTAAVEPEQGTAGHHPPSSGPTRLQLLCRRWFQALLARRMLAKAGRHAPALRELAGTAGTFNAATAPRFIALAQTLRDLLANLQGSGHRLRELDDLLRSDHTQHPLAFSYQLLKKARDLVDASLELADATVTELTAFHSCLGSLQARQLEASRCVVMFRLIESGFRTHIAALGSNSAELLVSLHHLSTLQSRLNSTIESAFARFGEIQATIANRVHALQQHRRVTRAQLQESSAFIQSELTRTRSSLEPAARISTRAASLLQDATGQLSSILIALQFQDIIRQRLEHVSAGFAEILHLITLSGRTDEPLQRLAVVRARAELELHQITAAAEDLEKAAGQLCAGSAQALDTLHDLLRQLRELNGIADRSFRDCRVSDLFAREVGRLNTAGAACSDLHAGVGETVDLLDGFIREFSRDFATLDEEVRVAVLNTQIGAARMESTNALSRLADETALHARTYARLTTGLTRQLEDQLAPMRALQQRTREFLHIARREQNDLQEEARDATRQLQHLVDAVRHSASSTESSFRTAAGNVHRAVSELEFLKPVLASLDDAARLCGTLVAETGALRSGEASLGTDHDPAIAAARERYTMERERAIHDHVCGRTTPHQDLPMPPGREITPAERTAPTPKGAACRAQDPPAAQTRSEAVPAASTPPAGPPDLGEGIELF